MEQTVAQNAQVLWDYMHMHMALRKSECILGFGSYDLETARRCAQLYLEGWAPRILFTGGLGRNTRTMFTVSEAERYRDLALSLGVPADRILLETRASNTGENIRFSREILEKQQISSILAVAKPFMERRVHAAFGICWPEAALCVTSPQLSLEAYIRSSAAQGMDEKRVIEILAGDFCRLDTYARRGFQLPQQIPRKAWQAFYRLRDLGYIRDLP